MKCKITQNANFIVETEVLVEVKMIFQRKTDGKERKVTLVKVRNTGREETGPRHVVLVVVTTED